MAVKNSLAPEKLEELVYEVIRWMKKWGLWKALIYSGGSCYSFFPLRAKGERAGWRDWEDVWVSSYSLEDFSKDFQAMLSESALLIESSSLLDDLFARKLYFAPYCDLPDVGRRLIHQRMDLFEQYVDWYDEYLMKGGPRFDRTEFDSFDEYWELESVEQEEFKLDLIRENLDRSFCCGSPNTDYNEALAELVLQELEDMLKNYQLQYCIDCYRPWLVTLKGGTDI